MPEGANSKQLVCLTGSDEEDRMLLHEAVLSLNRNDFEIIELCSPAQLMERFFKPGAGFPDFIFLDADTRGMTGFDCIGQIRKQAGSRESRIIVYTMESSAAALERAFQLGADFYAVKPNSYGDLKDLAKKVFQVDWSRETAQGRIFHAL